MMFDQIKPQKAKTFGKDKIKDLTGEFASSIKYDGHQIFIMKVGHTVAFFTSNWKQFDISITRKALETLDGDFMLVGEYMCGLEGKLGARAHSTKITTFRTNFNNGIYNSIADEYLTNIRVFDCVPMTTAGHLRVDTPFYARIAYLQDLAVSFPNCIKAVDFTIENFDTILRKASKLTKDGWEGMMAIKTDSPYMVGKRVHHAIKIKPRLTADLLCIDVRPGTGKYVGLIGSLECRDSSNRIVNVGSGLSDEQRAKTKADYIGKVVEVEYEKIEDTYIQPVFKTIRNDKTKEEID